VAARATAFDTDAWRLLSRVVLPLRRRLEGYRIDQDRSRDVADRVSDIADRLRTRFAWGLLADIEPPELEVCIAILRKKAAYRTVCMPDRDFPKVPDHREASYATVERAVLREMIERTLFSICNDGRIRAAARRPQASAAGAVAEALGYVTAWPVPRSRRPRERITAATPAFSSGIGDQYRHRRSAAASAISTGIGVQQRQRRSASASAPAISIGIGTGDQHRHRAASASAAAISIGSGSGDPQRHRHLRSASASASAISIGSGTSDQHQQRQRHRCQRDDGTARQEIEPVFAQPSRRSQVLG
jgi:hypothetical protein